MITPEQQVELEKRYPDGLYIYSELEDGAIRVSPFESQVVETITLDCWGNEIPKSKLVGGNN